VFHAIFPPANINTSIRFQYSSPSMLHTIFALTLIDKEPIISKTYTSTNSMWLVTIFLDFLYLSTIVILIIFVFFKPIYLILKTEWVGHFDLLRY
jgi:hypothetical protein